MNPSCLVLLIAAALLPAPLGAHDGHDHAPIGRWLFWPEYTLRGKARNYPGPRLDAPRTAFEKIDEETPPMVFFGERPTERIGKLLSTAAIPRRAFAVELWIVDHVNKPVGGLVTAKGRSVGETPAWVLGYHDKKVLFNLSTQNTRRPVELAVPSREGWKKYWRHVVATYNGFEVRLYLNGELIAQQEEVSGLVAVPEGAEVEVAAYLGQEPHMDLANLVREVRIYEDAISQSEVGQRWELLKHMVEEGIIFSDLFHFNAGPHLNYATQHTISILWETDRPARAVVHYGKRYPYDQSVSLDSPKHVQEITLRDLEPETNYFYEIVASDAQAREIRSGNLTFRTAVRADSAFSFAVIGDTESRPHINDVLAKAVWTERPNFILHCGDLTDGGERHHKFEWNLEYFLGMNQLIGRVPMFPVPGNGEEDLHWYNRYHVLPLPENYYSFEFGNAEFFMLDSNQPMGPGSKQYAWLDQELTRSKAKWKFAAHHHPTYSSDEDDFGDSWKGTSELGDLKVRSIVPLYEKHGVDVVFFGHVHSYERTWPIADGRVNVQRGVRYIQTGGGGGDLEDATPTRNWFSSKLFYGHHYCLVSINQGHFSFKMYDVDGRLRDYLEVAK